MKKKNIALALGLMFNAVKTCSLLVVIRVVFLVVGKLLISHTNISYLIVLQLLEVYCQFRNIFFDMYANPFSIDAIRLFFVSVFIQLIVDEVSDLFFSVGEEKIELPEEDSILIESPAKDSPVLEDPIHLWMPILGISLVVFTVVSVSFAFRDGPFF
jgi:hypothetical protein